MSSDGEDLPDFDFSNVDFDAELADLVEQNEPVKSLCRALVIVPIDAPKALRAALDMVGSPAEVVGLGEVSGAYLEVATDTDAESEAMLALLGEDRPLPKEVDKLASLLSKLTKGGAVALASWVEKKPGETAELSGVISARRYVNGKAGETLSSGLVLARIDLAAEELLLGRLAPAEVDDYQKRGRWTGWMKGRNPR